MSIDIDIIKKRREEVFRQMNVWRNEPSVGEDYDYAMETWGMLMAANGALLDEVERLKEELETALAWHKAASSERAEIFDRLIDSQRQLEDAWDDAADFEMSSVLAKAELTSSRERIKELEAQVESQRKEIYEMASNPIFED